MKLITAIIKPEKLDELIEVVIDNKAHGLTVTEVRGFGRQFGQLAGRADADGKTFKFFDFRGNTFYTRHAALLCDFA